MDGRQTLPSEVLLLIAEYAALREAQDPLHLGWAASLCLVCRSFRRVVTPILYAHVVVTEDNLEHLALLAREAPATLAWTRAATFQGFENSFSRSSLESLTCAMTRLSAFTGREVIFDYIDEDRTISSIFLTNITLYLHGDDVSRCIQNATRLHIVTLLGDPDIEPFEGDLSFEYLMIDVLAGEESAWGLHTPEFLQYVDGILDSQQALRRILLRPRRLDSDFTAERFYSEVEEWGKTQRDSRIWIQDIADPGPSFIDEDDKDVYEALNLQDALVGDELWLTGRQLCPPSVPAPVAKEP
ncbi:hypothetical protein EXIGLDRAFT_832466 [Exidia glandulosa HHB12029]|uniref:F-box domain-containing protein n=1 Tax=Exidia glandulosa HHB12029 TaxID=1314781 RepID=A0A165LLM4_EXIGL|nr:hypothetical protein EXIGLDRAFT_832466 [Exidia glandulosa HHB12029]